MLYKMFFDQSPDMMLIFRGGDGVIIDANEAAVTAFGCKREELLKKNFYSLNFSEDMPSIISGMNESGSTRIIETTQRGEGAGGFPLIVSLRCVVINEERIFFCTWIEISANKRIGEQTNEQLKEMVKDRDITGLKNLEERFRLTGKKLQLALEKLGESELIDRIIETSPAGIIVVNNDLKITFANARAEQLLGLKIKDKNKNGYKMPGWFFTDYQGKPVPDEELVYKQVISTGRQVLDAAHAIQWPDGTRTLFSINGSPLYDRSGRIEGAVLSIEDVTLRREAEERINSYQKQLRSLAAKLALVEERERRRIAEGIHDHIGQSLAVARLKIGALKKSASLEATLKNLDEINSLIEEAIKNTRSLTFELSPPVLYDLGFGAAVEWLGEQLLEKNGVGFNLINKLKPKSLCEEMRIILFTAVRELFFNIIKHARAKKVVIFVQKLGDKIQLEVKDDGTGFDTTLIGPGYRKSDGFGLFSINERLEHLGGRMEIESKPGHGTRITIEAPLTNSR